MFFFEKLRLLSGYIIGQSNKCMPKVLDIWVSSFLRTVIKYLSEQRLFELMVLQRFWSFGQGKHGSSLWLHLCPWFRQETLGVSPWGFLVPGLFLSIPLLSASCEGNSSLLPHVTAA